MSRPAITVAAIDAYLGGASEDEAAFEDALFEASALGDVTSAEFLALRGAIRELVRRGTYDVVISAREFERIRTSGLRCAVVEAPLGASSVAGEVVEGDDILLIRVALPLEGVSKLDVEMLAGDRLVKTLDDVHFDPTRGEIYFSCETELARTAHGAFPRHRFVAVEGGERRVLREIGFDEVVVRDP